MKRLLISLLVLFHPYSWAQEEALDEPMVVNSGDAEYNGETILLSGKVAIQHGLGKIASTRLMISPSMDQGKKMKFSFFNIEDDVVIELRGGGKLHCQQAYIDYPNLTGTFSGNEKQLDVTYTDIKKTKGPQSKQIPLIVKSNKIQTNLVRMQDTQNRQQHILVSQIKAIGNVRAYYNQDYVIVSDHATYERMPEDQNNAAGVLTLTMENPGQSFCVATNQNGDSIQANKIVINTIKRQLICYQPVGAFSLGQTNQSNHRLNFTSDTLLWDDKTQMLALHNNIKASLGGLGELTTEKELRIYQHIKDKRKTVRLIESPQNTQLIYTDLHNITHKLICYGTMTINHEQLTTILTSPKNRVGKIEEDKQVYFEDVLGDIYADQVILNYEWIEGALVPVKLIMQGHVKLLNRFDGHVQESGSVLQYALADLVEYMPQSREMALSGQNGQRVLFYDKVNNVQMSAPMLKIKRDEKSHKGSVKGIGDVRFTFIEHELNQLRQRFQLKD